MLKQDLEFRTARFQEGSNSPVLDYIHGTIVIEKLSAYLGPRETTSRGIDGAASAGTMDVAPIHSLQTLMSARYPMLVAEYHVSQVTNS